MFKRRLLDVSFRRLLGTTALPRDEQEILADFVARIAGGSPGFVAVGYPMLFCQFNSSDDEALVMLTAVRIMYQRQMHDNKN